MGMLIVAPLRHSLDTTPHPVHRKRMTRSRIALFVLGVSLLACAGCYRRHHHRRLQTGFEAPYARADTTPPVAPVPMTAGTLAPARVAR